MTFGTNDLLLRGESGSVEFKSTATDVEKSVAGMLNAEGGAVIIGVDSEGKPRGLADSASVVTQLEKTLAEKISPKAPIDVRVEDMNGKDIVVIMVPQGHDRPYIAGNKIYLREGTQTTVARAAQIGDLIDTRTQRWERQPCLGASLNDLDATLIMQVASNAEERWGFKRAKGPMDVLRSFNLADETAIRNSAIVLFGRSPSAFFPQTRVRAVASSESRAGVDNRMLDGNMFELLEETVRFVQRNIRIDSTVRRGQLQRTDTPAIRLEVLREALLNALVHRDYSSYTGGISVEIDSRDLQIWNSGDLPKGVSLDELQIGHASRPRNPDIAYVAFVMGLIERLGRGTQLIAAAYGGRRRRPQWTIDSGGIRLLLPVGNDERVSSKVKTRPDGLNERQRELLQKLLKGSSITAAQYAQTMARGVSLRQARSDLAELVARRLLSRRGQGRSTQYARRVSRSQ